MSGSGSKRVSRMPRGLEDLLTTELVDATAVDLLHHLAEPVDADAVVPARAGVEQQRVVRALWRARKDRRRAGGLHEARHVLVPKLIGEARGVRGQMPDRGLRARRAHARVSVSRRSRRALAIRRSAAGCSTPWRRGSACRGPSRSWPRCSPPPWSSRRCASRYRRWPSGPGCASPAAPDQVTPPALPVIATTKGTCSAATASESTRSSSLIALSPWSVSCQPQHERGSEPRAEPVILNRRGGGVQGEPRCLAHRRALLPGCAPLALRYL